MMTQGMSFQPASGRKALLDQIADIKFSKHVPLVVVLLSGLYAVWRSAHWLQTALKMPWPVAWPTSIFVEGVVLAASAALFIALREAFVAELKGEDEDLAARGVHLAYALLTVAFLVLLGIAGADAWLITQGDYVASFIMMLAQAAQAMLIMTFIVSALLDERAKLRKLYAGYQRNEAQRRANECPYCHQPVSPNNRARHIASCPNRPQSP